jgi:hypothetical protein
MELIDWKEKEERRRPLTDEDADWVLWTGAGCVGC